MQKKVVLVVIDALSSWAVRPAVEEGRLPNVSALIDSGQVNWNTTSVMPSVTPAATASLGTGEYPSEHRVMGAYYYDRIEDRVRYFSDDVLAIVNRRFSNFFNDFVLALNHGLLCAETIYQRLDKAGRSAAALNFLIYRGNKEYTVRVPWPFRWWPGVPASARLQGPDVLCLGDFVSKRAKQKADGSELTARGGLLHRYGFDDKTTAKYFSDLAKQGLPDFTLAYFPDNDFHSHVAGPREAVETVEQFDRFLGVLSKNWGGMKAMLDKVDFVITGDHSQSETVWDPEQAGIGLDQVLSEYNVVEAGKPWQDGDELMVCPNLRVAQIYLRAGYEVNQEEIISRLLSDERVDQVVARHRRGNDNVDVFTVTTADRGRLEFWNAAEDEPGATDAYGNTWMTRGDLAAVDADVDGQKAVRYGDYPNALERIATSFDDRLTGSIWVTAKVGHELRLPKTSIHAEGGSHGSLHCLDSTVPLITSASPDALAMLENPRTIDVMSLCMSLLNQPCKRKPGEGRQRRVSAATERGNA